MANVTALKKDRAAEPVVSRARRPAHRLRMIPPSPTAYATPSLEIHPLSIGGREDPVRLVFDGSTGPGINATMLDLGDRFRLVANLVDVEPPDGPLPKLPVARAVWVPQPELKTAAAAWILAGGAHHTSFSQATTGSHLEDFAEIAGVELLVIDEGTRVPEFKKELRWNEIYYHLAKGL